MITTTNTAPTSHPAPAAVSLLTAGATTAAATPIATRTNVLGRDQPRPDVQMATISVPVRRSPTPLCDQFSSGAAMMNTNVARMKRSTKR